MKKLWLVFKYEYLHHVLRKRFLFGVLSVPLLVGVSIGLGLLSVVLGTDRRPVGIVDNAGILNGALTNPYQNEGSVARTRFQLFTSTVDAQTTLDQRDIQGFYTIDSDYINTGSVTLTAPSALEGRVSSDLVNLLKYKLLKDQSDQIQVRLYDGPQITIRSTSDDRAAGESNIMGIILPIVAGILFIVTINISGGYLLQAVVDEKENRTMEIILTAVSTDQLMAGKILGNLSVGLTQLIIWLAATALGAFFFIEMQADASSFATGGTFLGMLALTALPAFVLVAALMAMLGAIATEAREAQQISGIFSIPLFVPLWFSYAILEHPNSALSIGFSLFPLTSPMTLPLRVAFSNVPAWQIALSLLILVISALGAVWLASRAFRLGMLRYGKKLTLRDLFQKQVRIDSQGTMNKTQTVFNYEFMNILKSRSFLLTLVLIPLAGLLVILVISGLQKNNQTNQLSDLVAPAQSVSLVGLVDKSGIVVRIPEDFSNFVQLLPDLESAQKAVEEGTISGYYRIPDDYLSSGQVDFYRPDFDPFAGFENSYILNQILQNNLLRDNPQLLSRLEHPLQLEEQYLSSEPQRDPNSELTFFLPYGITILFYILILGSSSTMLSSITNEKQNRVMEMLLTSMSPTQMLTGKILALGLIGLVQTTFWSLSGFLLMQLSGRTFNLPAEFAVPLSVLLWGILFFLLGYAMYASLMAGLGAMVPNLREGSQATFIVIMPLIVPMFFINTLIGQPNGTLSVILSLFPLTSPVAMMTRLAAVNVPFWQPLVAALLQLGTAYLIIRSISGMFRAQNLLTGQPFNYRLFLQALLGKA